MGMRYGLVCGISGGTPGAPQRVVAQATTPGSLSPRILVRPGSRPRVTTGSTSMGSPGEREGEPYFHFRTRMWLDRGRCIRLALDVCLCVKNLRVPAREPGIT